mmetsp:Transcript_8019/g.23749  ORF Transcript_8019/g.23749 Transcript_8019/m.23749 type:complete len:401 (+) Transcript_8019:1130-2332(+)
MRRKCRRPCCRYPPQHLHAGTLDLGRLVGAQQAHQGGHHRRQAGAAVAVAGRQLGSHQVGGGGGCGHLDGHAVVPRVPLHRRLHLRQHPQLLHPGQATLDGKGHSEGASLALERGGCGTAGQGPLLQGSRQVRGGGVYGPLPQAPCQLRDQRLVLACIGQHGGEAGAQLGHDGRRQACPRGGQQPAQGGGKALLQGRLRAVQLAGQLVAGQLVHTRGQCRQLPQVLARLPPHRPRRVGEALEEGGLQLRQEGFEGGASLGQQGRQGAQDRRLHPAGKPVADDPDEGPGDLDDEGLEGGVPGGGDQLPQPLRRQLPQLRTAPLQDSLQVHRQQRRQGLGEAQARQQQGPGQALAALALDGGGDALFHGAHEGRAQLLGYRRRGRTRCRPHRLDHFLIGFDE